MAVSSKGKATKEKILDVAQELILDRGYSGVSVDNVIDKVGVTKGAFFHHYKNKNDMAVALIKRYATENMDFFNECMARAEKLTNDPLQQVLILVGLYIEVFSDMPEPYPGCVMASYIYELQVFEDEVIDTINDLFLAWRQALVERFEAIKKEYPPQQDIDLSSLADLFLVCIEGAFILSKSLNDPDIVVQQLQHYKNYVELIFRNS
jgi:TetR/AcrR family transcriptional repressor of nem operon